MKRRMQIVLLFLCFVGHASMAQYRSTEIEYEPYGQFVIYNHGITLTISNSNDVTGDVFVYSLTGSVVHRDRYVGGSMSINLHVPDGLYIITISDGERMISEKISIVNDIGITQYDGDIYVTCEFARSGKVYVYNKETKETVADVILDSSITVIPVSWETGTYVVTVNVDGKNKECEMFVQGVVKNKLVVSQSCDTIIVSYSGATGGNILVYTADKKKLVKEVPVYSEITKIPVTWASGTYIITVVVNGQKEEAMVDVASKISKQVVITKSADTIFVICAGATSGRIFVYNKETKRTYTDTTISAGVTKIMANWPTGTYRVWAYADGKEEQTEFYVFGTGNDPHESTTRVFSWGDVLTISTSLTHYSVKVFDANGRLVLVRAGNSLDTSLSIGTLPAGVYHVAIISRKKVITKEIVKCQ